MKRLGALGLVAAVLLCAWAWSGHAAAPRRAVTAPVPPTADENVAPPAEPPEREAEGAGGEPGGSLDALDTDGERTVDLIVVDAEGNPIADVLAYEDAEAWFTPGQYVPGPRTLEQEPHRADSDGRLRITARGDSIRLYVFAPGHAWRLAEVPLKIGVEVVVELVPGGDAYLLIPRFHELKAAQVWAKRLNRVGWCRLPPPPSDSDEVLVRGLVPGEYEIRVCRGEWSDHGTVYGTAAGTVVAGETRTITVPVNPGPAETMVTVTGTVTLQAGWKESPWWILFKGAEESNADIWERFHFGRRDQAEEEARGLFRFRTENALPAGRYLVEIPDHWATHVLVSDRNTHFDFDVPAPVTVRVRVIDEEKVDVRGATVRWGSALPGCSTERASPEGDVQVFQTPPGKVCLFVYASGFQEAEANIDIQKDRELTMTLTRGATAIVRLRIDGKPFHARGVRVELRGPGLWDERGFFEEDVIFNGYSPGKWTLTLGDVGGCDPVVPQEIEVAAGETREVWFDL